MYSSSPPSIAGSPVHQFDGETMFDAHPIRYLLQCSRHAPLTGTAATTSTTLALKLRIPTTETRTEQDGSKKTYTVFLIQLMSCCASFSVLRRYSDFCALHRDLVSELPRASLPALPAKKLLGSSLDAEFVGARRAALEAYLTRLFGEAEFVNSRALSNFFVSVREVAQVQVRLGSTPSSRTSSTASAAAESSAIDAAALTHRMSSIASQLVSLEQKLKWVESSGGGGPPQTSLMEHQLKMINSTLEGLKKKVGVLELAQPYLQQMAHANNKTTAAATATSAATSTALAASSGMNGHARPFHSAIGSQQHNHRSVSGPVGSIRYDWNSVDDYMDDDEEDDEFGSLPRRSISQRVALHEKRPFASSGWPLVGEGFDASASPDEEDERGRSLSESHASDRDRLVTLQSVGIGSRGGRDSATSPASSVTSGSSATATPAAIPVRSVLDNSSRSLSSIDPWHSHKFQLRNRTESLTAVTLQQASVTSPQGSAAAAAAQAPRLTTRQHSDPLAANPNSAMHWYKQWVEELGIEVAATDVDAKSSASVGGSASGASHRSSGSNDANDKTSLFAGFGQAFPFITKERKKASGNGTNSSSSSVAASEKNSLFSLSMPLVLPPPAQAAAPTTPQDSPPIGQSMMTSSPAIALPKPSVAHPRPVLAGGGNSTRSPALGTSPELPHSPDLGSSPNLDSPELHALAAAAGRTTLSPRAYGISPVNLATIFPPPNLRAAKKEARKTDDDDDDDDDVGTSVGNFALKFEKEKVAARNELSSASSTTTPTPVGPVAPLPFPSPVPSVEDGLLELDPHHALFHCCVDAQLNSRMTDLLTFISPSTSSESRYTAVLQFIDALIKRQIGAEVFCHGSFALKTYLPDADLDVSAFFSKVHEETWVQKLVGALCQEAAIPTVGSQFAVKSVSFINAVCQVVKCQIGAISVDISGNQTGALATLALFEEVDKLVGQNHLFKRTILLTKTWCQNEAGIVDSGSGMLSSYCIRALVLYIFNAYHTHIKTPLQGLFFLLSYFGQFNFMDHAVGVFGPILLSALPKFQVVTDGPCAWPTDAVPLISRQLLSTYSLVATAPATGPTHKHKAANETLARTYLNVTDPCNPFNNLGRSVSQQNSPTVRLAFKQGSRSMRAMLAEWHAHTARRTAAASSSSLGLPVDELDELDALEAFKLVSKMFPKTVSLYSSFGGRGRFLAPRARKPRPIGLASLSEAGSSAVSGAASPANYASPQLRPTSADLDTAATVDPEEALRRSAAAAAGVSPTAPGPTPLDANLPRILDNLNQARQFETPDVSETDLVTMIRKLLLQYGGVPVGKLGSLLHNVMNNHSLPSMLKERYGGLKKFLERHTDQFVIGINHPFNPDVNLSPPALLLAQKEAEEAAIAEHQAQINQMAANVAAHGPHAGGHAGGYNAAHQGYGHGGGGGGGRGQQMGGGHYSGGGGRGGGSQRNQGQQQYNQGHHHYSQQQQQQQHGGNGASYNQKHGGGGGGRYANQQALNAAAAAAAAAQLQHQQTTPAFTAHPQYPLHHHHQQPTSPPYFAPGTYAPQHHAHASSRAQPQPTQQQAHHAIQYQADSDSAYADFPTLTGIMKQHR